MRRWARGEEEKRERRSRKIDEEKSKRESEREK